MATVTKSIKAGGDYTTIASWHTASYGGTAADDCIGELYDQDYDEADVTLSDTTPISVILRAASGNAHDGTAWGGGARVQPATATPSAFLLDLASSKVTYLQDIIFDANSKNMSTAIVQVTAGTPTVQRCILHNVAMTGAAHNRALRLNSAGAKAHRNIIFDIQHTPTTNADHIYGIRAEAAASVIGNTVDNIVQNRNNATNDAYGIAFTDNASDTIKNNLVTSVTAVHGSSVKKCYDPAMSAVVNAAVATNMSDDTTGSSGLTSVTRSNQYTLLTAGSEDYHLKSGADAIDAATDLVTTPTGVNLDIDSYDVDGAGVTWDCGADEFVAAATGQVFHLTGDRANATITNPTLWRLNDI